MKCCPKCGFDLESTLPKLVVIMTGPVRPTATIVSEHLLSFLSCDGGLNTHFDVDVLFQTWKHDGAADIYNNSDLSITHFNIIQEPQPFFINSCFNKVHIREVINVFKQHYSMNIACKFLKSLDVQYKYACRIRTDLHITNINLRGYTEPQTYYSENVFDGRIGDYFGFAEFDTFCKMWEFENTSEFCKQFEEVGFDPHRVLASNMDRHGLKREEITYERTLKNLSWMRDNMPDQYEICLNHWKNG